MRPLQVICLSVVFCLLLACLEVEARRGGHHDRHRKRGKHHQHGHGEGHHIHKRPLEKRGRKIATLGKQPLEIHTRKIGWLNVPEVRGCKCRHAGEICIKGPDGKPTCVQKHHLKESARLFKHYHDLKEKAEEELNEVDPPPHTPVRDVADPPHDVHISIHSQHKPKHSNKQQQQQRVQHPFPGMKHKPGKHHLKLDETSNAQITKLTCDNASLDEMRRRLTGWFHLLHGRDNHKHRDNRHHRRSQRHLSVKKELREESEGGECKCLRSVMWQFHQLDTDSSRSLSKTEVKVIDNNDMEPCLHPYLLTCDRDRDGQLSRQEWCCCFPQKDVESPCYAKLDEIEKTKDMESYIPSCDHEGYYHKEQCRGDGPSSQTCWCVTPTGSHIAGTLTSGRAHCGKLDNMGYPKNML